MWSKQQDNLLATAATNGAVVVWDIRSAQTGPACGGGAIGQEQSKSTKPLIVYSEHKRAANKVRRTV